MNLTSIISANFLLPSLAMPIRPPVKRKLVFCDEGEYIDHNPFPTFEMEASSINSTPLVPTLMDPKPMLAILLPKALDLIPKSPIAPLYDHIGYEVCPFP